jgi:cytochrome c oxidase subunit 3
MSQAAEISLEKHQDHFGAKIGMWLFLFTELLLFGGMFLLYAVFLNQHQQDFYYGSSQLDRFVGALNTIILLTSSLTMALSIAALQRANKKLCIIFLVITLLLATAFLVNKYFEWGHKIHLGIYPGSEEMLKHPKGEIMFYSLYYVMTGLHGLHVIVGMVIMLFMLYFILKKSYSAISLPSHFLEKYIGQKLYLTDELGKKIWQSDNISENKINGVEVVVHGEPPVKEIERNVIKLENSGLYWHLVDIIWIFLFPLFYLISM